MQNTKRFCTPQQFLAGLVVSFCLNCSQAFSQDRGNTVQPDQFVLGRHTFIDVGPPNNYYELYLVRSNGTGSSIKKVTLTPAMNVCWGQPARIEVSTASTEKSVASILNRVNPCAIPDRALKRERKRCKHCLVFSGANVAIQLSCGSHTRTIRADILDKDMFDPAPGTPQNTSWTMQLLDQLDQAVGQPGVLDNPILQVSENVQGTSNLDPELLQALASGKYDGLFKDAPDKPSNLYKDTQKPLPPPPTVELLNSKPFMPESFRALQYPNIGRIAHVQGQVKFTVDIDDRGNPTNFNLVSGPPMLAASVQKSVTGWKFPTAAANQQVEATVEFKLNCIEPTH